MSFFNPRCSEIYPGVIQGSALAGLEHRVCVSVERILDSCMKQDTAEHTRLHMSNFMPLNAAPPYKFISASSMQTAAIISDLSISRLKERPDFARVKCMVTIPVRLTLDDSRNERCTAESRFSITQDIIMYVPKCSVFPFEVKAVAAVNCTDGKAFGENVFDVTACYTIITKITADTDLLLPTYGFCPTPVAVDFQKDECNEFFDLPLYPSGK